MWFPTTAAVFVSPSPCFYNRGAFQKTEYCEKLTAARDMEVELYKAKLQAAVLDTQKCTEEKLHLQNEVLCLVDSY